MRLVSMGAVVVGEKSYPLYGDLDCPGDCRYWDGEGWVSVSLAGWPTPQARDATNTQTPETFLARQRRHREAGDPGWHNKKTPTDLSVCVQLASPGKEGEEEGTDADR